MTDTTTAVTPATDEEIEAWSKSIRTARECQPLASELVRQRHSLIARIDALKAELAESWDARRGLLVDVASITAEPAKHEPDCILAQPSSAAGKVLVDVARLEALERIAQTAWIFAPDAPVWGNWRFRYLRRELDALRAGEEGARE